MVAAMAPLASASSGRMEKGSSIWMPISSMPRRKKEMIVVAGMVAQWFQESPITGQMPNGMSRRKVARKRVDLRLGHKAHVDNVHELFPELLVVCGASEKVTQGLGEGGCVVREDVLEMVHLGRVRKVGVRLADDVAAAVDHAPPERACLIPPEIGRVSAEHEEKRERGHRNGEGERGKRNLLQVTRERLVEHRGVHHATEVLVAVDKHVDCDGKDGHRGDGEELLAQSRGNAAVSNGGEVLDEALGRSVLHPLVVHVDGAPILPRLFGVDGATLLEEGVLWVGLVDRGLVDDIHEGVGRSCGGGVERGG
eukprot:scaffold258931_cov30-Tisochrysis_lutea.AAC.1